MNAEGARAGRAVGELPKLPSVVVAPPARAAVVLRLLVGVGLVVGWVLSLAQPVEQSVEDLLQALDDGRVTELMIERPAREPGSQAAGQFRVEWSAGWRDAYAHYDFDNMITPFVDEGAVILDAADASPSRVAVTTQEAYSGPLGTTLLPATIAGLAALLLLIGGPQPRLATKWAWFWLAVTAAPLWLVFVLVEPVPVGACRPVPPARGRLTGGWALLLSFTLLPFVLGLVPGYDMLVPG